MDYVEAKDARDLPGLRLALTQGVPGPWSQSAKSLFHVKGIPYTAVAQYGGAANEDLVAWTGCRNAPVAIYDSEPPREKWIDILNLAERLKPEPRLIPNDIESRMLVVAIGNEICGEGGFGWSMRLGMLPPAPKPGDEDDGWHFMRRDYGTLDLSATQGAARAAEVMRFLTRILNDQKAKGSAYLVGDSMTAADIYWACFSQIVRPLPNEVNPMPSFLRRAYESKNDVVLDALDPILLSHRDMMYDRHLGLPLDF